MYRSLYIKIILIFVMFMITVMAVVGTVLLNSVFSFYTNDFVRQTEECFDSGLKDELLDAMDGDDWVSAQKGILRAYSTHLGIDVYRNYYILDTNGNGYRIRWMVATDEVAEVKFDCDVDEANINSGSIKYTLMEK